VRGLSIRAQDLIHTDAGVVITDSARFHTGRDRFYTESDRFYTDSDRFQTDSDLISADLDGVYTHLERIYTDSGRSYTVSDRFSTGSDHFQTGFCRRVQARSASVGFLIRACTEFDRVCTARRVREPSERCPMAPETVALHWQRIPTLARR
jgi:hypothetical protein